jgi:hypothetical protein
MNRKPKQLPTRPFFTRFLEKQTLEKVTGGGDPPMETHKFPSDSDEGGFEVS